MPCPITCPATKMLSCYRSMPLIMAVIATTALGLALISQYQFGLQPCNLCIWQRWPYGIVIALGLIGFLLSFKFQKAVSAIMGVMGITFLANSMIAFYHSGVERKWWTSFLEGCNVPSLPDDPDKILAHIQSISKAVRCDEIPWADPILGLSMANYNVAFCLGLAVVSFLSVRLIWKNS